MNFNDHNMRLRENEKMLFRKRNSCRAKGNRLGERLTRRLIGTSPLTPTSPKDVLQDFDITPALDSSHADKSKYYM